MAESHPGRNGPVSALPASLNLRDLGGIETADGRRTRPGTLFRSGVISRLDDTALEALDGLGIATVYDLRANHEREQRQVVWHLERPIAYHTRDYEVSLADLDAMFAQDGFSNAELQAFIVTVYRSLPMEQSDSFKELFHFILHGRLPLLFYCTGGKDRTGIAAALILFALGASQQDIDRDYCLTEGAAEGLLERLLQDPRYARLGTLPRARFMPMMVCDPTNLHAAFDEMKQRFGSVEAYLETQLGVRPKEILRLRERLLG